MNTLGFKFIIIFSGSIPLLIAGICFLTNKPAVLRNTGIGKMSMKKRVTIGIIFLIVGLLNFIANVLF